MSFAAKLERALLAEDDIAAHRQLIVAFGFGPHHRAHAEDLRLAGVRKFLGTSGMTARCLDIRTAPGGDHGDLGIYYNDNRSGLGPYVVYDGGWYNAYSCLSDTPVNVADVEQVAAHPAELELTCTFLVPADYDGARINLDRRQLDSTVLDFNEMFVLPGQSIHEWDRHLYDLSDRAPILADALMDAGCDDTQLLGFLAHNNPHVRVWAIREFNFAVQRAQEGF